MKQFPISFRRYGALIPVFFVLLLAACSKKGDPGPKGDNGKDGNANVMVFNFGAQTVTGSLNLTINDVTQGKMDSSFILVYYNPEAELASAWYPVPGMGSGAQYDTRFLTYQSNTPAQYIVAIRLMTPAGAAYPTPVKFRKVRVFVVPANTMVNARQASPVDYSDYDAVLLHYGIGAF